MRPPNWSHDRTHFFKYVTRDAGRAILSNCRLRWSVPSRFNDPFDIQFDLHADFNPETAKSRALDVLWDAHYGSKSVHAGNAFGVVMAAFRDVFPKLSRSEFDLEFGETLDEVMAGIRRRMPEFHNNIRRGMKDVKLLCLSEVHDNILMWSHYAEQHAGLVLRLKCIPEQDSPWGVARPVEYTNKMPLLIDDEVFVALASGQASLDHRAMTQKLVYTKALDWNYEREWRVFAGAGRSPKAEYEDIAFGPDELEAVYLGCRMPEQDMIDFSALVAQKYPNAKIWKACKSERRFELEFHPIA